MSSSHKPEYHTGERAVQERAGGRSIAEQSLRGIRDFVPSGAARFLAEQPMIILGAATGPDQVWASVLHGPRGFIQVLDERTLRIAGRLPAEDPLHASLAAGAAVGTLAIELETRRRLRVNGDAILEPDGITLYVREMFGNCQQYIQLRELEEVAEFAAPSVKRGELLTPDQQERLRAADTFFVASMHPQAGCDVSHRGGQPGFVHVTSPSELLWPDYSGNNMFQTLGNLAVNPACGLLFLDFESGSTLQLSGHAQVLWDDPRMQAFPGARRLVRFEVREIIDIHGRLPLRWGFRGYSPYNP